VTITLGSVNARWVDAQMQGPITRVLTPRSKKA
jgi:hypothetical protein